MRRVATAHARAGGAVQEPAPWRADHDQREPGRGLQEPRQHRGRVRPCSYAKGCVLSKIDEHVAALDAAGITNWWAVPQSFREPTDGYYRAPSATELAAILDRWRSFGPHGLFAYTWGDSCCGDDIGLRDLPELWPVYQRQNAG